MGTVATVVIVVVGLVLAMASIIFAGMGVEIMKNERIATKSLIQKDGEGETAPPEQFQH